MKKSQFSITFKDAVLPRKVRAPPIPGNPLDTDETVKRIRPKSPPLNTRPNAEIIRLPISFPYPKRSYSATEGADTVVKYALFLNASDTTCKFVAAYITGSKSLFAEAIHSLMDTVNQVILYLGIRYSKKNPDTKFPYGYGNARYVSSLISGCGILSFGCGLSIYHGINALLHPSDLEPLTYAFYALGMSLMFQGSSLTIAFQEANKKAKEAGSTFRAYVTSVADPSLNVVLLEDGAAVTGVLVALSAITMSSVLQSPIPDALGSVIIGGLLGVVATFIIRTNAIHLVGRSVPKHVTDDIISLLENDPVVRSVHDVKATSLGVEKSRFKAELDFNGYVITQKYLREDGRLREMYKELKSIEDEAEFEKFMAAHGEQIIDRIGDEIDRVEKKIRSKYPAMRHVDLEAL